MTASTKNPGAVREIDTGEVVDRILAMVPAPTPVWNTEQRQASHQQHAHQPGRM